MGRRAKGEGTIRKLENGKFEARYYDERGDQRSKTFSKESHAVTFLRKTQERVEAIRAGRIEPYEDHRLFKELCDRWVKDRASKRSIKTDASLIKNHLKPALGEKALREINGPVVDRLRSDRAKHVSENSVNHVLVLLGSMLRHAVELHWLSPDAVPTIRKYKLGDPDFSYLRPDEEIRRFLVAARADDYEAAFTIYSTLIYTGMRIGELAGLRWDDVDFQLRLITIQRSYDGPTTKGGRIRRVPIFDPIRPVLEKWKIQSWPDQPLVFTTLDGDMLRKDSRVFDEILKRVLGASGLMSNYISIHDLRHTFASWWLYHGGDFFRLQRMLGHRSPATTMRYAHLAPEAYEADRGRLPDLVSTTDAEIIRLAR